MRIVLVNATSCAGAALKILEEYIEEFKKDKNNKYYVFVPDNFNGNGMKNVEMIRNEENKEYKNRNMWNLIGMRKWIKNNKIKNYTIFSLQNYYPFFSTGKAEKKMVYLHQSIPFYKYKWSVLTKKERRLWFYKNVYKYLIMISLKKSDVIIVQTNWFKDILVNKYGVDGEKIQIKRPEVKRINSIEIKKIDFQENLIRAFYPAGGMLYKNHKVLIEAMNILINTKKIRIKLYLTLNDSDKDILKLINKYGLDENVIFLGQITFDEVMEYYKSTDILVFPSKVETFGMPLVEAQFFNMPIVVNNHKLYKEVIGDYTEEVIWCDGDNPNEWSNAIEKIYRGKI